MAAQNKLFQRLIWLVDTIYSAKHITREEIDRRWANSHYNDMHESQYGERNFHRHRETIAELFGIDIVCNHATKEYSLGELGDAEGKGVRAWLVNTFAINNMVNLAGGLYDRIIFEEIPEGTRYLSTIVNAMRDGKQLYVSYQNFVRPEPHSFLLSPYCLKLFNRRWYVIGKPDDHPEEADPRVYSLDRVKEMAITEKPFRLPKDFKASKFFANQFGVDRRKTEAERIRVKMSAYDANYMRTLPIHDSQFELEKNDQYSIFGFYVAPTNDFIQELRKFGSTLEVLEPEHLRIEFKEEGEKLNRMYE